MTAKRKITDKNGAQVFPITHTKAVLDDNGNSVEQRLQEQMDVINQKQLEVGAVPSDTVPTENSSHWVTSGGVFKGFSDDELALVSALIKHDEAINKLMAEKIGVDEEKVISAAVAQIMSKMGDGKKEENDDAQFSDTLTIANSEKISVFGSSFGTGSFNIAGKNWVAKLSLFSDYQFENLSFDGFNYTSLLRYLRLGQIVFKGRYALLCDNENTGIAMQNRLRALDNIATWLKTYGAEPILATSYTDQQYQSALWRQYADLNNHMFWDAGKYCSQIRDARNGSWDGSRHLATRNSQMVTDAYMPYMLGMERPRKSMKIFRMRDSVDYTSLDNVMFRDNMERAKLFKEIYVGNACNKNPQSVDNIASCANGGLENEYRTLSSSGKIFDCPVLISAVISVNAGDLENLTLNLATNNEVSVYVMNRKSSPFPEGGTYSRFSVPSEISAPSLGSKYSYNGTEYTVESIVYGENGYYCTIYCSPSLSETIGSGTLAKVSGSGSQTIPFEIGEISTLDETNIVVSDTVGHWEEVSKLSTSKYALTANQLKNCLDIDKIHFLVIPQAGETLFSDISISWSGTAIKPSPTRRYYDFSDSIFLGNELLSEPTFATSVLSSWKNDNNEGVRPVTDYENKYPQGSAVVNVDDNNAMKQTVVNLPCGRYVIRVVSRYFPPIYTDGTGNQITLDSYDYETLNVMITNDDSSTKTAVLTDTVGTYWKISQFAFDVFTQENITIRVNAGSKGLEINSVSLKKL